MRERPEPPAPLAVPVADAHCHLDVSRDDEPPLPVDRALELAAAAGVPRIVQIGCDLPGARWAVRTARAYDGIVAGIALHPNDVPPLVASGEYDDAMSEIEALARSTDRVRVIGETGLDHFRTPPEHWSDQERGFRDHVRLAVRLNLPLEIHDRDAHADILRVLDDEPATPPTVVMHCFSGDAEFAAECLARGYVLSFAGTVTFANAGRLRAACIVTPPDRILVETDAPYLTPTPHRGAPNASYLIPLTVRAIAQAKGIAENTLCRNIAENTTRIFGDW